PVCPGGGVSLVEHWHGPRHPLLSPHLPSVLGQGAPDGDDRLLTRHELDGIITPARGRYLL
ncbi:MAG TPA: hypothetical protein VN954_11410, partial [Ktedonobacteraceae bacterium]|nr:hypothetical protein [Ktedonobacteraceae bacterium]